MNRTHAVVVVEHDMDFVRRLACDITVFNRGRILVEGPGDAVLASPEVRARLPGRRPCLTRCWSCGI